MTTRIDPYQEHHAALAFSSQAVNFDDLYASNTDYQYKRKRVRDHLLSYLAPGSHILELNAGTGDDAVFLAQKGHMVHATDISEGMQKKLNEKLALNGLTGSVSQRTLFIYGIGIIEKKRSL